MAKKSVMFLVFAAAALAAASAATYYVDASRPDDSGDGLSWATAKKTIQAAIDLPAVVAGDAMLVTNGVYDSGGRPNYPAGAALTNRVAVYKPVTVRSVNGPSNTFIRGRWHNPGGAPGDASYYGPMAVRCVYLTNGAVLSGFTLTNGATFTTGTTERYGGGVHCETTNAVVSNCVISGNCAYYFGGGVYRGELYDCVIAGNYAGSVANASDGGAACFSRLHRCALVGNSAYSSGGGVRGSVLYNCLVANNSCPNYGGGLFSSVGYGCTITGNSASTGGGAYSGWSVGALYNCVVVGNRGGNGGGVNTAFDGSGPVVNCLIAGNNANNGGGAYGGFLYNCTVTGNSAGAAGGGTYGSTNWNCIVYENRHASSSNYSLGEFHFSCSAPMPAGGTGNIDVAPRFQDPGSGYGLNHILGNYRLANGSPCVNAGTNFSWQALDPLGYGRDKDLDGGPRIYFGTVDMGAYERIPPGTIFMIKAAK